jgi:hypothetical protein
MCKIAAGGVNGVLFWVAAYRIAAVIVTLTLTTVGLASLQPYTNDDGLEDILPDLACDPPCVMGIQPGVTSAAEALALLDAHPLVAAIVQPEYAGEMMVAEWTWTTQVPALAQAGPSYLVFDFSGRVGAVRINTQVQPAQFHLHYGAPTHAHGGFVEDDLVHVVESYRGGHFNVYYVFVCANQQRTGAEFIVRADSPTPDGQSPLPTSYAANRCRGR